MTVVRPNSIAGINSITVQTGQALNIHDASGNLIRSLTNESGISTFSGINIGTAATIFANGNATFSGIVTASSFSGATALTGSTNNTLVTVTGANAITGEATLTYDGTSTLELQPASTTPAVFVGDSNRTGAGQHLAEYRGYWNGTTVGRMVFQAGADTTNKDDGRLVLYTATGGTMTEHFRIDENGKTTIGGGIQDQQASDFNSGANQLLITSNGATGLTIDSTSSTSSSIHFADGSTGSESYRGIIEYNHSNDYFSFGTSGSHRLKLEDGDLTLNGAEGISANLYLIADEGDDDGDGWRVGSNQDSNDLTFANNTSGSYADKMCLKSDGKLSFNGDEDTYITRSGTNTMQIQTNGTLCTQFSANQRVLMPQVYSTNGSSMNDVQIESDGTLCAGNTSIRASKKNIVSQTDVSWLYDLNPVTFNYRKKNVDEETGEHTYLEEAESETSYGLIAEEVESVKKDFVFHTNDKLAGVYYKQLITPLLKAVQEHKKEIEILKTEIAALKSS